MTLNPLESGRYIASASSHVHIAADAVKNVAEMVSCLHTK